MADGKLTCFEVGGHRTKAGTPCGYFVPPGQTSCPHHATDKTQQSRILAKARHQREEGKLPNLQTNDFQTLDDCLRTRAQIVASLCKDKVVDFRRLELALKCCNGASTDHATLAAQKQNEILLMLDGHGAGVAALNRLRESSVRVLPGRKNLSVVKGDRKCGNEVAAAVIEVSKKEST